MLGVQRGERHVPKHDRRSRTAGKLPERQPVLGQFLRRRGETGRMEVGIVADPPEPREMLERAPHAGGVESVKISAGDLGNAPGIAGDGPGGDVAQPARRRLFPRAKIDDRSEVEGDAQSGQAPSLPLPVSACGGGRIACGSQAGQRGHGFEQGGKVRDAAAFLVGGHDQRRQPGPAADRLQFGELGRHVCALAAADIAAGQVDAADQAFAGQGTQFIRIGVAGDHVRADRPHGRAGGKHRRARQAIFQFPRRGQHEDRQEQPAGRPEKVPAKQPGQQRQTEQQGRFGVAPGEQQRMLEVPGRQEQQAGQGDGRELPGGHPAGPLPRRPAAGRTQWRDHESESAGRPPRTYQSRRRVASITVPRARNRSRLPISKVLSSDSRTP